MGFLVVTCIGPISSFLGIISLRISMLIMAFFIVVCAGYSYLEAEIFFKDTKAFGLVNKEAYAIIEGGIALLIAMDFFVKKKCYTRILYLLTFALAGCTLAYNIFKISIMNDKIKSYEIKHKLIQFMFFIRIGAEFIIQMIVCFMCYSYKKDL